MLVYILMQILPNCGIEFFSKDFGTTLQLLGKSFNYSFFSSNTPIYDALSPNDDYNPYSTLRIRLHDKLTVLTPLLTPRWFSELIFQYLDIHATFLRNVECNSLHVFIQTFLTLIVKL